MATPTLNRFLQEINNILKQKDGQKLQDFLILEPPYPEIYTNLIREFKQSPLSNNTQQLELKLEQALPDFEGDAGGAWNGFRMFLASWLNFISQVDVKNIMKTHNELVFMVRQSQIALGDSTMGIVVLPTVIFYARTLARFTVELENQPDLLAEAQQKMRGDDANAGDDTDEGQVTLASTTASVIIEALKKCINERAQPANGGIGSDGRPAGRRIGIYVLANICLKLLTRAKQFRSAETIFTQIKQLSPPLSRYPVAQRITYLYCLGRYHFSNNHFLRASRCLQAAFNQCCRSHVKQKQQILIYLIAANIIVGRLPSQELLARPEASLLRPHFQPLMQSIKTGDLPLFRQMTSINAISNPGSTPRFLLIHGIFLQLQDRCEVIILRTLARRVFKYAGFHGSEASKAAPNLDIPLLRGVLVGLEKRYKSALESSDPNYIDLDTYVDPDFEGLAEDELDYPPYGVEEIDEDDDEEDDEEVDEHERHEEYKDDNQAQGSGGTNNNDGFGHNLDRIPARELPTLPEVEMAAMSLVRQGLLHGFISHKHQKFLISGARNRDPIQVGFPPVFDVLKSKENSQEASSGSVVGWVTERTRAQQLQRRGGGVRRLANAEPVGA